MATWTIQISSQSGQGSGASGTHATTLGQAQPGDFDGATINSVSVTGTPGTTVSGAGNDEIGVWFIVETSAGTDIYGTADPDASTMCYAPLSTTGSTITDGGSTSPAPTTAVAADWDNVYWEINYNANAMPDGQTLGWSQFDVVVDYTASSGVTVDDFPAAEGPDFTGQQPTVRIDEIVPAGNPDALLITEQTPVRVVNDFVNPASVGLRVWSVTGLTLDGCTPTVTVSAGGNVTVDDFPAASGPEFTGQTPTIRIDEIVPAGNPDALVITEQTPTAQIDEIVTAGNPDALITTGQDPVARIDEIVVAGNPDALVFGGDAPTIPGAALPDTKAVVTTGQQPTIRIDEVVVAGNPDALITTGQQPLIDIGIPLGNPDALITTGQQPTIRIDEVVVAGSPDALVTTGQQPLATSGLAEQPTTRAVSLTGQQPTIRIDEVVVAGNPDSLVTTGQQPTATIDEVVVAGAPDALIFGGDAPTLLGTPQPGTDALTFSGTVPVVLPRIITVRQVDSLSLSGTVPVALPRIITVPTKALTITGTVPAEGSPVIEVPHVEMRVWSVTGLQFVGCTPTVSVDAGADTVLAGDPDALITTGQQPTARIDEVVVAGSPDSLLINEQTPTATQNINVQPTTRAVSLTGQQPTAQVDEIVPAGNPDALVFGGDAATITVGLLSAPTTRAVSFTGQQPTARIDEIVVGSTGSLVLTGQQPVTSGTLVSDPTTKAVSFTGNQPTALVNATVQPTTVSVSTTGQVPFALVPVIVPTGTLTLDGKQVSTGFNLPGTGALTLSGQTPSIAIGALGTIISNPDATTDVPTNFEQCDYTGFRQLPGSLKMTWNKYAVRRKSFEERNPQEFHGRYRPRRSEGGRGPVRTEQDDRFIGEELDTVDPEDL